MTKAVEANKSLGVLLWADNHLSNVSLVEIEYAMGRPKSTVRELVGQVRGLFTLRGMLSAPFPIQHVTHRKTALWHSGGPDYGEMGQRAQ